MLSRFFLKRPVFAWVIAIILMVAGGLAIHTLPISQYPPIAPPSIAITAVYPGASAETVENSVTQIIEQKMTGFDSMLYLSATSDSAGSSRIELTFAPGTDPDLAWAQVQNKLQLAMASLPEVVQRQGVQVSKSTKNYLIVVGLISEDGSMDGNDLRDYAQSTLEKVLSRVPGVGEVQEFGSQYSMRIWLNPDKLTEYQHDDSRCGHGAASLQRGSVRRAVRRSAGGERPAPECLHHCPEPAQDTRGVCRHPHPHQSRWFHRAGQGCGTDGTRDRILRCRSLLQWQARRRHGHPTGRRRQCPGYGQCHPGQVGRDERIFPSRHEGRLSLRHHALRQGGHRRGGQDPFRGDPAGLPGDVSVHGEHAGHA